MPTTASFKALLAGSQLLPRALWGYLVLGSLVMVLAVSAMGLAVLTAYPPARIAVYVAGFVIVWAYVFAACVGTWRSASRTRTGPLRVVAKAIVVILMGYFLLILFEPNGVVAMLKGTWQPGSYLKEKMKQK